MKIAYSLGSLGRGGTETLLLDVFRNAKNADFDFIGIYRKVGFNSLKSEFEATEQKLFRLSPKFPFDLLFLYKLRKLLQKARPQYTPSNHPSLPSCLWCCPCMRL